MKFLLAILLLAPISIFNPKGSDAWQQSHDLYWGCLKDLLRQGREYKSCGDQSNLISRVLGKPQIVLNKIITDYPFSNHPCEDKPGVVPYCRAHAQACTITRTIFDKHLNACQVRLESLKRLLALKLGNACR